MINNSIERLTTRVLTAIDSFKGYSHAIVIGGGALVADAIRERMGLREDRFVVAEEPQFAGAWSENYWLRSVYDSGSQKSADLPAPGYQRQRALRGRKIEAHHRGDRGDMSRTALLAGCVREVDSRLPSMLAALLAEDTKPETLRKMLASFLRSSRPLPPRQPRQQPPRLRRRSRPRR